MRYSLANSFRKNCHCLLAVAAQHGVRRMRTFKSPLRYFTAAVGFTAVATFAGCVMIPYETPEVKAQIQHDLKLELLEMQAVL